ncbi:MULTISPECIES: phytanoyl-CoA dioxygenase family protein [Legionella]|uniref:Phytanoyl-CoA dioxygenase (PhyH) n=1 Tax=Legionella drozanskii LLAP-1 TaxID=1212489 RepID=A0A0W0TD46_9GAMM|nr:MULTISPECIES: phytanoyl-CoA dioxygenase family protein [Legionella]KTC93173.1 Phytanoyl-CoA dioxygenase (PhyH) [Legionella drozanskii LLAP-1]PJE14177.1 MAG: hypothetical protein CK430_05495 [Legionella sp.]
MNYCKNGYELHQGFFDQNEIKFWQTGASYLKEIPEIVAGPMKYFEKSQLTGDSILNRVEKFCDYLPLLDTLVRGEKIRSLLKDVTGRDYRVFKEKINFKLAGAGGFKPHQDGAAFRSFVNDELVTIIIPIHTADDRNGCFRISKNKFEKKIITHTTGSIEDPGYDVNKDENWQSVPMQPGDILCFSSYLVHQSNDNLSSLDRSCYFITYSPYELGDQREKYFAYKREKFPPRIERDTTKDYESWRQNLAREII